MVKRMIKEAHDSKIVGHMGTFKTAERIRECYWWPNMDKAIEQHVCQCPVCQATTNKGTLPTVPPIPLPDVL
jgi:hypothetical protein